jgi:hypothetical protein
VLLTTVVTAAGTVGGRVETVGLWVRATEPEAGAMESPGGAQPVAETPSVSPPGPGTA